MICQLRIVSNSEENYRYQIKPFIFHAGVEYKTMSHGKVFKTLQSMACRAKNNPKNKHIKIKRALTSLKSTLNIQSSKSSIPYRGETP